MDSLFHKDHNIRTETFESHSIDLKGFCLPDQYTYNNTISKKFKIYQNHSSSIKYVQKISKSILHISQYYSIILLFHLPAVTFDRASFGLFPLALSCFHVTYGKAATLSQIQSKKSGRSIGYLRRYLEN